MTETHINTFKTYFSNYYDVRSLIIKKEERWLHGSIEDIEGQGRPGTEEGKK